MSQPKDIPARCSNSGDPPVSPGPHFKVPSPFLHRRHRTESVSEDARRGPALTGVIKEFCRQKGHGFIIPDKGGEPMFLHISDIEGDYVPKPGDAVTYHLCRVPPKMEKFQAVHVRLTHLAEGQVHETWESPVTTPVGSPK